MSSLHSDGLPDRRDILKVGAAVGGGLLIGFSLQEVPGRPAFAQSGKSTAPGAQPFAPNAWLRIATDNTITIIVDKSEMPHSPPVIPRTGNATTPAITLKPAPAMTTAPMPKGNVMSTMKTPTMYEPRISTGNSQNMLRRDRPR